MSAKNLVQVRRWTRTQPFTVHSSGGPSPTLMLDFFQGVKDKRELTNVSAELLGR